MFYGAHEAPSAVTPIITIGRCQSGAILLADVDAQVTNQARRDRECARALDRLAAMEASVIALGDEDLLDLADIFASDASTPLREMAGAEMRRRKLSL